MHIKTLLYMIQELNDERYPLGKSCIKLKTRFNSQRTLGRLIVLSSIDRCILSNIDIVITQDNRASYDRQYGHDIYSTSNARRDAPCGDISKEPLIPIQTRNRTLIVLY